VIGRNAELANNWIWSTVGEIGFIASGQTPKELGSVCGNGEIPFFKISDMNKDENGKYMISSNIYLSSADVRKLKIHVQKKGTIIFPKRGGQ
jgi:type I restriction enzyme, S subunit